MELKWELCATRRTIETANEETNVLDQRSITPMSKANFFATLKALHPLLTPTLTPEV